jgi:hypothetical protein
MDTASPMVCKARRFPGWRACWPWRWALRNQTTTRAAAIEAIKLGSGTLYDPEAVRAFLRALPKTTISRKEREVLIAELQPGMVLAKGIYTPNGLLLVPEGQPLNEGSIGKILNHNKPPRLCSHCWFTADAEKPALSPRFSLTIWAALPLKICLLQSDSSTGPITFLSGLKVNL